jgi:NTP pyrophosphatase (non-canonical NTP hydrolase)
MTKQIAKIQEAQVFVKQFAIKNKWQDEPNIDKFDHLHEELIEMSKILRYKNLEERQQAIIDQHQELLDGMGDLFFAMCRLANQLNVDVTEAFNLVKDRIEARYTDQHPESVKK